MELASVASWKWRHYLASNDDCDDKNCFPLGSAREEQEEEEEEAEVEVEARLV